jgi:hypothetical protein
VLPFLSTHTLDWRARRKRFTSYNVITRGQSAHVCTEELGDQPVRINDDEAYDVKKSNVVDRLRNEKEFSIGVS